MKKKEEYELLFENRNRREIIFHKMNEDERGLKGVNERWNESIAWLKNGAWKEL